MSEGASRLRLVPASGSKASSGTFVMLLAVLLGVKLLGLLAVNTLLAQGSFTTSALAAKQDALAEHEQQLQQEVALLQSPQQLAVAAGALGMVGTHNPVFIDTRTGKILGVPQAAPRAAATVAPTATATTGPTTAPTGVPTTPGPTAGPTSAITATATAGAKPSPHPSVTGAR
jgi:hypothetical protein